MSNMPNLLHIVSIGVLRCGLVRCLRAEDLSEHE
jgi:hypothetical protein